MRILLVGDIHEKLELPYGTSFSDGRRPEWNAVKQTILRSAKDCDIVILLGDNLHMRNNPSVVLREFVEFLNGFGDKPVHILCGNHEVSGRGTALDFLKELKHLNWHVYTDVQTITHPIGTQGLKFTFMPYMTPGNLGVKDNVEATKKLLELTPGGDILFLHHTIQGSLWTGDTMEHLNEPVLPRETLEERYGLIVGGHIHKKQWLSKKTLIAGSMFTDCVGEEAKSVWIHDTNTGKTEEIPLPVRGIYKVMIRKENEMTFMKIPDHSIVKCIVISREANLDKIREMASRFDASIIIEQYPRERQKVHFTEGALDLSVDNMLKVYAENRKVDLVELKTGFELIRN